MVALVGLRDRIAEEGPPAAEVLAKFRHDSAVALERLGDRVSSYPILVVTDADGAEDGDWYKLSMERSAIQFLLDDYADTPVPGLLNPVEIQEPPIGSKHDLVLDRQRTQPGRSLRARRDHHRP